jgi:hypothetical protein
MELGKIVAVLFFSAHSQRKLNWKYDNGER